MRGRCAGATTGSLGAFCDFEGKRRFPGLGINLNVLQPGQPMGMYHRENRQEDFLVLAGECLLIVDGEERELTTWDLFHSPPGTEHIIVGAGTGPAVVLAVGARGRRRKGYVYPVSKAAQKHGAGVKTETTSPSEAYGASRAGSGRRTRRAGYPSFELRAARADGGAPALRGSSARRFVRRPEWP